MTTKLNNVPIRNSAVIYKTALERIKDLLEAGRTELAGEYAIATIELALTTQFSSEDFDVKMYLKDFKVMAEKNGEKYDKKKEVADEARITKLQLREIVKYLNQGLNQTKIADKLSTTKQTISNRVQIIKQDYPFLLDNLSSCQVSLDNSSSSESTLQLDNVSKSQEESKNEVDKKSKFCQDNNENSLTKCQEVKKVKNNVNVNVNDNVYMDKVYSPAGRKDCPEVSLNQLAFMGVSYEELDDGYIRIKETGKMAKIIRGVE